MTTQRQLDGITKDIKGVLLIAGLPYPKAVERANNLAQAMECGASDEDIKHMMALLPLEGKDALFFSLKAIWVSRTASSRNEAELSLGSMVGQKHDIDDMMIVALCDSLEKEGWWGHQEEVLQ